MLPSIRNISAQRLRKRAYPLSYCSSWLPTMSCFNFGGWSSSVSRTFIIRGRVRQPITVKAVASLEVTNLSTLVLWMEPLQEGAEQSGTMSDCQRTTADRMQNREVFDASFSALVLSYLILPDEYIYLVLPCLTLNIFRGVEHC